MGADFFEQIASFFVRQGLDELLFGGGQDTLQADDDQIADQVSLDVFRPPAQVLLREVRNPFADCRLNLALGLHFDIISLRALVALVRAAPDVHLD
jgi:hypothetical protein